MPLLKFTKNRQTFVIFISSEYRVDPPVCWDLLQVPCACVILLGWGNWSGIIMLLVCYWGKQWSIFCLPLHRVLSHSPSSLHINQTQHCKLLPGLVSSQAQLCRSNLELMQTIIQAAREVKKTCQKTFGDMRWNCSSIEIPADALKYRPDLDRGAATKSHYLKQYTVSMVT